MKLTANHANFRFVIEEDLPEVGWNLLVFNQKQDCFCDDLQNSLVTAKEVAYQDFGVPLSAWEIVDD